MARYRRLEPLARGFFPGAPRAGDAASAAPPIPRLPAPARAQGDGDRRARAPTCSGARRSACPRPAAAAAHARRSRTRPSTRSGSPLVRWLLQQMATLRLRARAHRRPGLRRAHRALRGERAPRALGLLEEQRREHERMAGWVERARRARGVGRTGADAQRPREAAKARAAMAAARARGRVGSTCAAAAAAATSSARRGVSATASFVGASLLQSSDAAPASTTGPLRRAPRPRPNPPT